MFFGKIAYGDIMKVATDIERLFNYLDSVALRLHEMDGTVYLNGVSLALSFLLDDVLHKEVPQTVSDDIAAYKAKITGAGFDKETVRKAIQLALLKGFKSMNITNSMMTPDSIGIFIAYIIRKLYDLRQDMAIFDPLVGTGNLLATINNHAREDMHYEGVDVDPLLCELARNVLDALEIPNQIYHQDTLMFSKEPYDLIVTDFPIESIDRKAMYFPYRVILKHSETVKPGRFFLALIENDFFDQKESDDFKKTLSDKMHLYGLIKFDEGLFKSHPKSLLILQRKKTPDASIDDFLMADLPPFTDEEAFNASIGKIEQWFKKRKVD